MCESGPGEWQLIGAGASDYGDLIVLRGRPDVAARLVAVLLGEAGRWRRCMLENLPEGSLFRDHLTDNPGAALATARVPCPTLVIEGREDELDLVRRKKSLRRHHNYFRKQEGFTVRHLRRAEDIQPHLSAFFEQHQARWRLSNQASLFDAATNRRFYEALVQEFDATGWLVFTMLSVGERAIAYHLGFEFGKRFIWYKPSFDPKLAKKSPGEALLAELFQLVAESDVREFDFTVGDEAFKKRFANEVRHNQTFELYASGGARALRRAYLTVREGTKRTAVGRSLMAGAKLLFQRR